MTAPAWREVAPAPPPAPLNFLLPAFVVLVPFSVQFGRTYPETPMLAPRLAAVLVVMGLLLRRWPWSLPLVAVGAVAAFEPVLGLAISVRAIPPVVAAFALLAMATGALPVPGGLVPPRLLRPCLLPLVPAGILLLRGRGLAVPSALIALGVAGVAVPLLFPSRVTRWLDRASGHSDRASRRVEAASEQIGRALGALLMLPGLVIVTSFWAAHRLVGYHPLPRRPGWVVRHHRDREPNRLFSSAHPAPSAGRRLHRLAALLMVVLAGSLIWIPARGLADEVAGKLQEGVDLVFDRPCGGIPPDEAMDGDPGWPAVFCETEEFRTAGGFDAVTTYKMADYEGRWVNVRDGARRTWQPPPCDACPTVRLWLFGGSAAFGWWQRDDHSLGSALAKAAWEEGIRLEVTTRAMPGWVHGQESRSFADLVLREDVLPHLALFYHGGNDLVRQFERNWDGRGDDESATTSGEVEIDEFLRSGPFPGHRRSPEVVADGAPLSPTRVATHAMNRYRRDLEHTRRVAGAAGIDPIFAWQPLMPEAPRHVANDNALSPEELEQWREALPVARRALPSDVIDLSDAFDELDQVVFKDLFHTNEHGSAVAAAALLEEILPTLRSVADAG